MVTAWRRLAPAAWWTMLALFPASGLVNRVVVTRVKRRHHGTHSVASLFTDIRRLFPLSLLLSVFQGRKQKAEAARFQKHLLECRLTSAVPLQSFNSIKLKNNETDRNTEKICCREQRSLVSRAQSWGLIRNHCDKLSLRLVNSLLLLPRCLCDCEAPDYYRRGAQ